MEKAEDIRCTIGTKAIYDQRKETIERVFGTAKEHHAMRYTQQVGKEKMAMKVGLTFACMNMKKLANILSKRPKNGPDGGLFNDLLNYISSFFFRCPCCWEQLCGRARTWAVRCQQLELRGRRRFTSGRVAWSDPWGQPESLGKQVCPRCFLYRRAAVQGMRRGQGMGTLEQPETRSRERQAEQERGCPPMSSHLLGPLRAAM